METQTTEELGEAKPSTVPQVPVTSQQLQQMLAGTVPKQQISSGTAEVPQMLKSTVHHFIEAAMQRQRQQMQGTSGTTPQVQRVVVSSSSQVHSATSQLQQMISGSSQIQQGATNAPRVQQIIVTSSQLQQLVASSSLQQNISGGPQLQTIVTSSTPLLEGVIGSPQLATKPAPQPQVMKTAPQYTATTQSVVKQTPSGPTQVQVKQYVPAHQLNKQTPQNVVKPPTSPQMLQTVKIVQQPGATGPPQYLQVKTMPSQPPASSSPQVPATNKPVGVTATPRLQQMVAGTPKKTTPQKAEKPAPKKPQNLGELIGKLTQGSRHVKRFKEDRRNIAKAVKPLTYGAFGSYAPSYDSSFANLSKEESDLINGSYSEFEPSPHIKSILSKNSDYTFTLADSLIDILSGGDSKRIKLENEDDDSVDDSSYTSFDPKDTVIPKTEEDELQTLTSLGLDLSHLTSFPDSFSRDDDGSPEIQQKLEYTTGLLKRLQQAQYDRLSVPPHPRLGHTISPPSDAEVNLATEITGNLTDLAKQVPPGALILDRVCMLK